MDSLALERCAYCRQYVPVTWVEIAPAMADSPLSGRVAVCQACHGDGR